MSKQPERINSICQHNSTLHNLTLRAQHLERLNHLFQHILPTQFSAHCRLANINAETVIIHTDNASYASLIRFQAPVLCKTLSTELGSQISKIEVRVRPQHRPLNTASSNTISLPRSAASALQQTAQDLEEGSLKTALEKLAKRQR